MGLQNQLSDASSDSIPLFLLFHIANCVSYLRKVLFGFLQSLGLSRFHPNPVIDDGFLGAVGSGLASVVLLAEQLSSRFSYTYSAVRDGESGSAAAIGGPKCVVCLCRLRDGDSVRRLPCRHVFTVTVFRVGSTNSSLTAQPAGRRWSPTSAWLSRSGASAESLSRGSLLGDAAACTNRY